MIEKLLQILEVATVEELEMLLSAVQFELTKRQPAESDKTWWARCPTCNGTGKHRGGYCACQMGRDIRKVEAGGLSYDVQPE